MKLSAMTQLQELITLQRTQVFKQRKLENDTRLIFNFFPFHSNVAVCDVGLQQVSAGEGARRVSSGTRFVCFERILLLSRYNTDILNNVGCSLVCRCRTGE